MHPYQPATVAFNATRAAEREKPTEAKQLYNAYEGVLSGRQLSETVPEFLARCPPLTTSIATHGPWIYIGNPYAARKPNEDIKGFVERGHEILSDFDSIKEGIELSMAGKTKIGISKKLTAPRKQLQKDLFAAAREKGCTTGKWMMFPNPKGVNELWAQIATATANGELGRAAKVAADDGNATGQRLICVYTYDIEDKDDVKRVMVKLRGLGAHNGTGAGTQGGVFYYKADAYTHLDIMRDNRWGLKASLYSSSELFGEDYD